MLDRYETWQYWLLIDSEQLLFYTKSCISNPWPRAKVRIWENFRAQSPIMQIFPLLGGQRLPPCRQAQLCLTYKRLYNSIYFIYSKLSKRTVINIRLEGKFPPVYIRPAGYSMLAWEFDKTTSLDGIRARSESETNHAWETDNGKWAAPIGFRCLIPEADDRC